jgi:hypothetical protein
MKKASQDLADIQDAAVERCRLLALGKIAVWAPAQRSEAAQKVEEIQLGIWATATKDSDEK